MIEQYKIDGLGGEYVKTADLEKKICDFLGVKHAIMCSSGTAALFLATKAIGAQRVGMPALSMIATANAVELAGGTPVFADEFILPDRIDAYIHVSLNGRHNGIESLVEMKNVVVIEDACQSFGSKVGDKYLGTFGDIGCFSFSPQKILTSGNGGCCVTNSSYLANRIRKLKNFGRLSGGDMHNEMGYNFKFTDIQAEVLLNQFSTIHDRIEKKKHIYNEYMKCLSQYMLPHDGTPWYVDIYVDNPNKLAAQLRKSTVGTRQMYPIMPSQLPYLEEDLEKKYPKFLHLSNHGLWLPSSLDITDAEIEYVSKKVLKHLK